MSRSETVNPPLSNRGVSLHQKGYSPPEVSRITPLSVSPGVDWITATVRSRKTALDWFTLFDKVSGHSGENRGFAKDWKRHGYEGRECSSSRWAIHPTYGGLIAAWGGEAGQIWQSVAGSASKVTRLDLKVDVTLKRPWEHLAHAHYKSRGKGPARKCTCLLGGGSGDTMYLGSRNSDFYGRIYNKGKQQGSTEDTLWRYEVQVNKPKSHVLARRLLETFRLYDDPPWYEVTSYVYAWFDARGIVPVFRARGNVISLRAEYVETTAERKIAFLRQQVAPTVDKLIKAGLGKETLDALGLTNAVQKGLFDRSDFE